VQALDLKEVLIAPRCPWQSPLIGSIRWECLDHVIVINRAHLQELLRLGLDKNAPEFRNVQGPEHGNIIALPHKWEGYTTVTNERPLEG
jgi:hypothetical protein